MMTIDYDYQNNRHTKTGAGAALPYLFPAEKPASLLDVGCGIGTWLQAALEFGIPEVFGVDGSPIHPDQLLVPPALFMQQDLTRPLTLGRKFAAVLCLEVAEHLDEEAGKNLIRSLTQHGDTIYFSAACPDQLGQHHINCQWPAYWQSLFNAEGFTCSDDIRWEIWECREIERWYRQNMFLAVKSDTQAGREKRIPAVVHPEMLDLLHGETPAKSRKADHFGGYKKVIEQGKALARKVKRKSSD